MNLPGCFFLAFGKGRIGADKKFEAPATGGFFIVITRHQLRDGVGKLFGERMLIGGGGKADAGFEREGGEFLAGFFSAGAQYREVANRARGHGDQIG